MTEILVQTTSEDAEVVEVHARRLLDWRKSGKEVRLVDNHYVGEKKIVVREFVIELED